MIEETKTCNDDNNESLSVETDSDAFHSLDNSGNSILDNVESPMKKQRVDSPGTVVQTSNTLVEQKHRKTVEKLEEKTIMKETYTSTKTTETVRHVQGNT